MLTCYFAKIFLDLKRVNILYILKFKGANPFIHLHPVNGVTLFMVTLYDILRHFNTFSCYFVYFSG